MILCGFIYYNNLKREKNCTTSLASQLASYSRFQVCPLGPSRAEASVVEMKTLEEPPYLKVGTDVSAKYRGAFCEAKIKTAKRLVKVKVTFKQDLSTGEIPDEHIRGPLKVGAAVEVKCQDGLYQEATINKLTDASLYTVVFDDGDEKTLRRSSLCLKGARHFAESETLDQLPLTNPEHFGTPVIGKKSHRGRRSNPVQEEELSSSSSEEEEGESRVDNELLGKVVCVECLASCDKKKTTWYPALVISPDCSDEVMMKKDSVLVRSFKDGKFYTVLHKDVRVMDSMVVCKTDASPRSALDGALDFLRRGVVPSSWRMELKEDSSSSEEDDDDADEGQGEDASSEEEEEEVEPFPEEGENFLQQLYKFMEDRGTPINKRPVLGYKNLNLFKLYRLVHRLGGFDNIDSGSVWKQVYQDLGIPVLNSAAGYNVKCAYRKYLYGFEEYCTSTGITFQMDLPVKAADKLEQETEAGSLGKPLTFSSAPSVAEPSLCTESEPLTFSSAPSVAEPSLCTETEPLTFSSAPSVAEPSLCTESEPLTFSSAPSVAEPSVCTETEPLRFSSAPSVAEPSLCSETQPLTFSSAPSVAEPSLCSETQPLTFSSAPSVAEPSLCTETEPLTFSSAPSVAEPSLCTETEPHGMPLPTCQEEETVGTANREPLSPSRWPEKEEDCGHLPEGQPEMIKTEGHDDQEDKEKLGDDSSQEGEGEEFECYPPGMKVHVRYGRGRTLKTYEATVKESDLEGGELLYLVHYCGWNVRYDEWIRADKIIRPANKNVQKIKHRKRIKTKTESEKGKLEALTDKEDLSPPRNGHAHAHAHHSIPHALHDSFTGESEQSIEISSLLNGLPGSECSTDASEHEEDDGEGECLGVRGAHRKSCPVDGNPDGGPPVEGPEEDPERPQDPGLQKSLDASKRRNQPEPEAEVSARRRRAECKGRVRGGCRPGERPEEGDLLTSSSSSEDEELRMEEGVQEQARAPPDKRKKGMKEKMKGARPSAFWETPEKKPKPAPGADDRLPGGRSVKGQKDVWSSIQAQWPKKTLKELFSDSDTEAASSPPPRADSGLEEKDAGEAKPFPSSGSNSVLNTPPTTPESPCAPAPEQIHAPASSPPPPGPTQEENVGGRSETDSSTVEVESLGGEVQELPPEVRSSSPSMAFEGSLSSNSNCSLATSSSSQMERGQTAKVCPAAMSNQKRSRDPPGSGASKKHKQNHRSPGTHPKKSRKSAHSSDSEDQTPGDGTAKHPASKARAPPSGHNHREHHANSTRIYKWSFQMSDLEKMSSLERVTFLQEKLQDIRNHYLSLKSEVASIDRRRKRQKKKEGEGVVAATSSSSSSSSPSSSSLTAAVMLTLSEPVSGSSQNSGVSVECR